ncbi:UDP-N-acetylglucosamine 1-carboxyvinyltransferase [Petrotoga mexicana DSM 14811]|uniref:UDP-N-acetylglucosamine 1-carboxyvinyltransferase n=1 Tax=Petrotoga mexicana DSM 14811 TaxID=1122954 RepID=A0A2K1PAE1_9BACT|nr:UDP-N-acetylglucosamine 1-carboxyvinyltransferase [Petrotoga mexicana]PNR99759.1 UDP-N-acetylglucosamine 1-carboxyvinyltransferase [Petrotoga mexicana DSM 14811]
MKSIGLDTSGKMIVKGPQKAKGTLTVSGSKNAVLPIMGASLLTDDDIELRNVPDLADVRTMIEILESAGKVIERFDDQLIIRSSGNINSEIPYEPVRKMRASFNVYGPLTLRNGYAKVALPGGCSIGARPVDFHLEGLKKLGIESTIEHGFVTSKLNNPNSLINISLPFPSVGATEHVLTTACLLEGVNTTITNCAIEPEVTDLVNFLNKMGAKITGGGTSILKIEGVKKLSGIKYTIIPDRIEAGTYIILGKLIGQELTIKNVSAEHLNSLFSVFENIGSPVDYDEKKREVRVTETLLNTLNSISMETAPFPGFPTDLQPQITTFLSLVPGRSTITETVFKSRFYHIDELNRMGAKIRVEDNTAIIEGVSKLSGAPVEATDLRAAAALLIAGLVAEGETIISNVDHIFRGYENIHDKLEQVGIDLIYEK